jgi:hypothetical protein
LIYWTTAFGIFQNVWRDNDRNDRGAGQKKCGSHRFWIRKRTIHWFRVNQVKMEVDVTNKVLKTTCLIDPDLLSNGENTESPVALVVWMTMATYMIMVCITLGLKTNMNNLIHK